jgi:hypothetical protein
MAKRRVDAMKARQADESSVFYFTDLSPIDQEEIDLFWPYEGSELDRAIALRLATRSAEDAVKAAMAWDASKRKPCHMCGERLHMCKCVTYCLLCGLGKIDGKPHTCYNRYTSAGLLQF